MSRYSSKGKRAKLSKGRFYFYDNAVVRIARVSQKANRVVLYRYDIHEEEAIELDTAPFYLTPAFKIGEMARMLNRKETTIRRYETAGLIPTPRRIHYSKKHPMKVRIYSVSDAFELAEFFSNRRSVGRPSSLNSVSRINYKEVLTHINARYESIG